jgi:hypothetical protein
MLLARKSKPYHNSPFFFGILPDSSEKFSFFILLESEGGDALS